MQNVVWEGWVRVEMEALDVGSQEHQPSLKGVEPLARNECGAPTNSQRVSLTICAVGLCGTYRAPHHELLRLRQGYPPSPHMMGQWAMGLERRGGASRGRTAAVRCFEPSNSVEIN